MQRQENIIFIKTNNNKNPTIKTFNLMENKNQSAEMRTPNLRQLVMEHTQRINRNELSINKMRMDKKEFEQRMRRHDEWLEEMEHLQKQFRLDMQEWRAQCKERDEKFNADLKQWRDENEKERRIWSKEHDEKFNADLKQWRDENEKERRTWSKEHDEKFNADLKQWRDENEKERRIWSKEHDEKFNAELNRWKKERDEKLDIELKKRNEDWEKKVARMDASMEEMKKSVQRACDSVDRLSAEFHSVVGHIVEGLLGPNGHKMFMEAGFRVDRYCKDMHRKIKELNMEMEVDVLSYGEDLAIATEVKTNCRKKDIDEYLNKMKLFRVLFTEHKDKEVIAGIAAVNFERDAYEYAKQQGILIIHVIDESIFILDPIPDKSALRRF